MYSYEIIFQQPDRTKKSKNNNSYIEVSESIVASNSASVLDYVSERLKMFPEDQLVAIVRRYPIIKIIEDKNCA
jgi:hypothetical protein